MPIILIIFTGGGGGNNFKPTKPRGHLWAKRGSVPTMQGDGSTSELGGIMEVTMLGFDPAWV
jgi:hypothetical protein